MNKEQLIVGVGGLARAGKDLFCAVAANTLKQHNKTSVKLAFADELKNDIDGFCKDRYKISAWTTDPNTKRIIRRILVAHGCIMREIGDGTYWIKKMEEKIEKEKDKEIIFISDVRFLNEVKFVQSLNGKVIHLSKYNVIGDIPHHTERYFQLPPNDEEKLNDPLVQDAADYTVEWEDVSDGAIYEEDIIENEYINKTVGSTLKYIGIID
jgi:hypothetical protein